MFSKAFVESLSQHGQVFLVILTRVSATLGTLTFFNREMIPSRILVVFSAMISLFAMLIHGLSDAVLHMPNYHFYLMIFTQMMLGFVIGFIVNLFIGIFVSLGQIVSMQSGLGFINLYIPKVGSITSLSNFFIFFSIAVFFQLNGHLALIKLLIESFTIDWIKPRSSNWSLLVQVVSFAKIIFSSGLMLSLSTLIALMISNMTMGFMTKFAPQINILSIGINVTLIISFFMLYLGFDAILENGSILLNEILNYAHLIQTKI